jgi:hypothetical protein
MFKYLFLCLASYALLCLVLFHYTQSLLSLAFEAMPWPS